MRIPFALLEVSWVFDCELLRLLLELFLTGQRAKVIGLALILAVTSGILLVNSHSTNWIHFHKDRLHSEAALNVKLI